MLSRFSVLFVYLVAGLAVSAVATPMGGSSGYRDGQKHSTHSSQNQCNVGKQHCCTQVNKASERESASLLALFGIEKLFDATALVGKNCSPALGLGASCEASPVCCEHTEFEGFFAFGCSNLNVNILS